ncbi:MAG: SDR family oxidoreductase [Microthrixaceae bacterium]
MAEIAVVTGANSGIGLATALCLASGGYQVFAAARRPEGLEAITEAASMAGLTGSAGSAGSAGVVAVSLDVNSDDSVAAAFQEIQQHGPVAVLVNNAGITAAGSIEETPVEEYQAMFNTNVLGIVRCTQQVLPRMRQAAAGSVVNISSSSAVLSPPLMGPYASTKRAVESLSESLQSEVAPFGIRVILVQAGTILTPIWGKSEVPTEDTAYPQAREFLLEVLTHNLMNSGVPPETVSEVILSAVKSEHPTLRHLVGDAEVLAGMRERHSDDELMGVFALQGEEFRKRYSELSRINYWG